MTLRGRGAARVLLPALAAVLAVPAVATTGCASSAETPPATPAAPRLEDAEAASRGDPGASRRVSVLPSSPLARASVPVPSPDGPAPADEAPDVLRRVGERVITAADLGAYVARYDPETALRALESLAEAALVEMEAAREGVQVADATVESVTATALEEKRRALRLDYGASADPDAVLRERFGRSPEEFHRDVRDAVRTRLLRDRLVRLAQLREDGVEIRVLVLADEKAATEAAARIRAGADPTLLSRKLGVRPPSAPAPLARADVPEPPLRDALFAAHAGDVLDPVPFDAEVPGAAAGAPVSRAWQVFKVVRSWRGSSAPWPEMASAVEGSLASAPVRDAEASRWRSRAAARLAGAAGVPPDGAAKGLVPGTDTR